jgi:HK97 family phage major capsid protein
LPDERDYLDSLNSDFAKYRETLDERVKALASTQSVAEIDAKLDKINEAMDASSKALEDIQVNHQAKLDELALTQAKLALGGGTPGSADDRILQARQLIAWAQNKPLRDIPPDAMSMEDFGQYEEDVWAYARRGQVTNLMVSGGDPAGGYLVSPDTTGGIIRLVRERSQVRAFADVRTTGSNRVTGRKRLDDIGYGWVSERAARPTTTTPEVGQWAIDIHDLYANPDATQDEIDDAFVDIGAMLVEDVGDKFARVEGEAFVKGTGVGQPRGFGTYPLQAATTKVTKDNWGTFRSRNSGAANAFPTASTTEQALIDLVHDLKESYLPNARWYMNRATLAEIRKILVANIGYIFMGNFREDSPYGDIMGYPVTTLPDMNVKRSSGSGDYPLIAFGDMRATYRIYDRQGIRILFDPYTAKPNVNFYCTKRVGGDVVNFDSLVFLSQEA